MKNTPTNPASLLKAIKRGDFRHCYLIYNRKSTDEPNNQKNSITYQKAENSRYAAREELPIANLSIEGFCHSGAISERHSGFKESDELIITDNGMAQYRIERPKFQQLLQYLNQGYFKGAICLCWDRISRNEGDDTIIKKLIRKGVDVRFVHTHYENSSAGKLHMNVDGMFAQHHSRVTSEKVTLSTRNLRSRGKCTYRASIGYLNIGNTDNKPQDPERAPVIAEMFELYATGDWSLSDLACYAKKHGVTTVPMRRRRTQQELLSEDPPELEPVSRPLTENHISRILTNPFYTGKIIGTDGAHIVSTSHKPLVDDDLFNRVQIQLQKKTVSIQYAKKLDHPLRGMIRCAHCQRVYTPYEQKSILYFGARCTKDCSNQKKSFNFGFITDEIHKLISGIHFTDEEWAEFAERTSTDFSQLEEKRAKQIEKTERNKKRIRADLAYLRTEQLSLLKSGAYSPESIVEERQKLEMELDSLVDDELVSETAIRETMDEVVNLSELLKNLVLCYDLADPRQKEQIIKKLFSELYIDENTVQFQAKMGLEVILNRPVAVCDPIAWLSELQSHRPHIRACVAELQELASGLSDNC